MNTANKTLVRRRKYHPQAYQFVFAALRHAQEKLGRVQRDDAGEDEAHISGQELLAGARELLLEQYGLLTLTVLRSWGVTSTDDFGRIVFELIERGEMRKTDRDRLSDFMDVYTFSEAFDSNYQVDTSRAFRR